MTEGSMLHEFANRTDVADEAPVQAEIQPEKISLMDRARAIRTADDVRAAHFGPDISHGQAWDILLLLFIEGENDVASLARAARGHVATARRWIAVLEDMGHAGTRQRDDATLVALTSAGRATMTSYLSSANVI